MYLSLNIYNSEAAVFSGSTRTFALSHSIKVRHCFSRHAITKACQFACLIIMWNSEGVLWIVEIFAKLLRTYPNKEAA